MAAATRVGWYLAPWSLPARLQFAFGYTLHTYLITLALGASGRLKPAGDVAVARAVGCRRARAAQQHSSDRSLGQGQFIVAAAVVHVRAGSLAHFLFVQTVSK